MSDEEDRVVLTYGDTTLYESDVALLRPGQWLNDSLIAFWFEYLTQVKYKDHAEKLLFTDPSAMFMINFSQDAAEIREAMAPLEMGKRELIFMPINDNDNIERAGGTHWSLLVYSRKEDKFRYYDSFSTQLIVPRAAKRTAKMVHAVLGGHGEPQVEATRTPQQTNSSGGMLQRLGSSTGSATRKLIAEAINKLKGAAT